MRFHSTPLPGLYCALLLALPLLILPLLTLPLLTLPLRAHGQAQPFASGGEPFAAPADVLAAAAKITPEKYAKVTVLFEEEKDVLDSQGRVTNTHRLLYRIETQAGLEEFSESAVAWEAFYQNQPAIRARVIRSDGSAVDLDARTITDVPARNQGDGTYSDERIHKAPLPGSPTDTYVLAQAHLKDLHG